MNNKENSELKPCPFCIPSKPKSEMDDNIRGFDSEQDAISAWNIRADSVDKKEVDKLREELAEAGDTILCWQADYDKLKEENEDLKSVSKVQYRANDNQIKMINDLEEENAMYREALEKIAAWDTPYKGFEWDKGSNGQAEHIKSIAKFALNDNLK